MALIRRGLSRPLLGDESGQAFTEYVLMLAVVISVFLMLSVALVKTKLAEKITAPFTRDFAYAYRYGSPKARGYDDGGPVNHVRATTSGGDTKNFRLFINQVPRQ